jgi:D-glycero-alpha-D-manno-heptose 1-phosphate guanylyltransferase
MPMKAVAAILAGGLGTRLRAAVSDRPKVLADVSGRPFLEYLLRQLEEGGVLDVVLCVGYQADKVEKALGDKFGGLRLRYSGEQSPLGTGGALRLALPLLEAEIIYVMNGDSYCEFDLPGFLSWHQGKGAKASMALASVKDTGRYGRVVLDQQGLVLRFEEKGQSGPGLINAGVYIVRHELIAGIAENCLVSLEKDIFPRWVEQDVLYGYQADVRKFIDIGTPESWSEAQELLGGHGH